MELKLWGSWSGQTCNSVQRLWLGYTRHLLAICGGYSGLCPWWAGMLYVTWLSSYWCEWIKFGWMWVSSATWFGSMPSRVTCENLTETADVVASSFKCQIGVWPWCSGLSWWTAFMRAFLCTGVVEGRCNLGSASKLLSCLFYRCCDWSVYFSAHLTLLWTGTSVLIMSSPCTGLVCVCNLKLMNV